MCRAEIKLRIRRKMIKTMENKKSRAPKCANCRNHNVIQDRKGHKRFCPYRDCMCDFCGLQVKRRQNAREQIALRRRLLQDEELGIRVPIHVGCQGQTQTVGRASEGANVAQTGQHSQSIGWNSTNSMSFQDLYGMSREPGRVMQVPSQPISTVPGRPQTLGCFDSFHTGGYNNFLPWTQSPSYADTLDTYGYRGQSSYYTYQQPAQTFTYKSLNFNDQGRIFNQIGFPANQASALEPNFITSKYPELSNRLQRLSQDFPNTDWSESNQGNRAFTALHRMPSPKLEAETTIGVETRSKEVQYPSSFDTETQTPESPQTNHLSESCSSPGNMGTPLIIDLEPGKDVELASTDE
ncbi:hypothetical protein CHS0354_036464 [Potamilus streckersoni]|uniref:DM domain-containing protein n=1 Tax=Potamilus streckersoni TaxID=2493646 RepID=A0AAE0SWY3_9BIVA|nr:hypothetical protein CHS0354_036464 [Potamilus streckersoni]